MKNKYLRLFPDSVKIIMKLSPVGQTEIFAAMDARNNGNIFEFSDKGAEVVWWSLENQFKRDDEAYLKRCQKNRIASKMRCKSRAVYGVLRFQRLDCRQDKNEGLESRSPHLGA